MTAYVDNRNLPAYADTNTNPQQGRAPYVDPASLIAGHRLAATVSEARSPPGHLPGPRL
jgi:hypothetical protein